MSTLLNREALRRQMAIRGMDGPALAAAARLPYTTVASALRGNRVREHTAWQIARALTETPASPVLAELVGEASQ